MCNARRAPHGWSECAFLTPSSVGSRTALPAVVFLRSSPTPRTGSQIGYPNHRYDASHGRGQVTGQSRPYEGLSRDRHCQCLECCGFGFLTASRSRASIVRWRFSAHCSLLLKAISVANVAALTSLGKTTTTLVRLFTFSNKRSSMFVVRIRAWWLPG